MGNSCASCRTCEQEKEYEKNFVTSPKNYRAAFQETQSFQQIREYTKIYSIREKYLLFLSLNRMILRLRLQPVLYYLKKKLLQNNLKLDELNQSSEQLDSWNYQINEESNEWINSSIITDIRHRYLEKVNKIFKKFRLQFAFCRFQQSNVEDSKQSEIGYSNTLKPQYKQLDNDFCPIRSWKSQLSLTSFINTKRGEYDGEMQNGLRNGFGIIKWPNGAFYKGYWQQGAMHGKGRYWNPDNLIEYNGNWQHGNLNGTGTLIQQNNCKYQGEFKNGRFNGQGQQEIFSIGTYTGQFRKGLRNGKGSFIYLNKDQYIGEWKNNEMHGYGTRYFNQGDIYKGQWKNGLMNGNGTYLYQSGQTFKGIFFNGTKHGEGTIFYPDGSYYKGVWNDGKREGQGQKIRANGRIAYSNWTNGERDF